jgi:hypothetical protein
MEGFSNWDREEPFEPFTVMLFKGLQVVAFMFFLAYLAINSEAKQGNIDTKAQMLVTVSWPDNHPDDIDTYVEDPRGNIVWYHVMEAGMMSLDRDDRGDYKNMILVNGKTIRNPIRQEIVQMRALIPGEYVVNIHHYLATTPDPVPVSVTVEKINPKVEIVYYDRLFVDHTGDEKTAVRFTVGEDGKITDINTRPKSLIRETRKVRSNIIPAAGGAQRP